MPMCYGRVVPKRQIHRACVTQQQRVGRQALRLKMHLGAGKPQEHDGVPSRAVPQPLAGGARGRRRGAWRRGIADLAAHRLAPKRRKRARHSPG
jgi:hypothetical protein